jgi:hypothetical protein
MVGLFYFLSNREGNILIEVVQVKWKRIEPPVRNTSLPTGRQVNL